MTYLTNLLLLIGLFAACQTATPGVSTTTSDVSAQQMSATAVFAGGCFWCTEAVFERVKGVKDVVSGYTGGEEPNPTYDDVSYGRTTHVEAVKITYDPAIISYSQLLKIFFIAHFPTQGNGQGPDIGEQYRPFVFYQNDSEKEQAAAYIKQLNDSGKYKLPIATELAPADVFYLAEDYHQNYYELHPKQGYIVAHARPKVQKLKKTYPEWVKEQYRD